MLCTNVRSILLIPLPTFLLVAVLHNSIIDVFSMHMQDDEWSRYRTTCSTGGYWEQRRLTICFELSCTKPVPWLTQFLPKLLFHKGCLWNSLFWQVHPLICVQNLLLYWIWILLYHRISETSVSPGTNTISVTFLCDPHWWWFFLEVGIYFA